ncbi:hypothetical protein [Mangrovibacter phragmitis]|uniref:hypothetical protein n=1 Tax=Mangrovibacter phragmitis TaxID=1691903 RepID=UPI00336A19B4
MPVNLYFDGMHGIGDNIIQRAFIKALVMKGHQVWLKTPLPELYVGIPHLYFVRADTRLRTQRKSEMRSTMNFALSEPALAPRRLFYGNYHLQRGGIFKAMEEQFGVKPAMMDLPTMPKPKLLLPEDKLLALIRPTTERTEWHNASRGPLNKYIDQIARILSLNGFYVVSIADTEPGAEWIPDMEPFADLKLNRGELTLLEMLGLIERSSICVTGPGVAMLAAIAYRRPMLCIQGGCGGSNHHSKITDPECMDLSDSLFIYPDHYCMCQEMKHNCDKTISDLESKVTPFIERVKRKGT